MSESVKGSDAGRLKDGAAYSGLELHRPHCMPRREAFRMVGRPAPNPYFIELADAPKSEQMGFRLNSAP